MRRGVCRKFGHGIENTWLNAHEMQEPGSSPVSDRSM